MILFLVVREMKARLESLHRYMRNKQDPSPDECVDSTGDIQRIFKRTKNRVPNSNSLHLVQ